MVPAVKFIAIPQMFYGCAEYLTVIKGPQVFVFTWYFTGFPI